MEVILFLIVGLAIGWFARFLMKGSSYGLTGDIIVGILGALIGGLLFRYSMLYLQGGLLVAIIVSMFCAILLLFILRLIRPNIK